MAETIDNKIKQPSKKSTGFTNIQRVLGANVGNRLGSTVGQGVQQVGQQAKGNIQQSVGQFQQQSEQNRIGTTADQQLMENVLLTPEQANAQQQSRFQQLMTGTYKGPQELANKEQLASQASKAQFLGNAAQTAGGRVELLKRFARPDQSSYTIGKQSMDNLLLAQNEEDLRAARRATQGLENYYSTQDKAAQGLFGQMTADATRIGGESQQRFGKGVEDFYTQLEADRLKAIADREALVKGTQQLYSEKGGVSQADLERLGLQQYLGQSLYNLNLGDYLTQSEDQATLQNIASQEQVSRLNALKNLAGTTVQGDVQSQLGLFEGMTPEQIQTFQKGNAYNLDAERLQRDFTSRRAYADRAYMDVPGVSDKFWEANDALGRYIPGPEREKIRQDALRGNISNAYGPGAAQALRNIAETQPILEAEKQRRMGTKTLQVIDPYQQVTTGTTPSGNIV